MVDRLELAYSEDAGWAFKGEEHNAAAAPVQAVLNDHEAISYRRARPPARPPAAVRAAAAHCGSCTSAACRATA